MKWQASTLLALALLWVTASWPTAPIALAEALHPGVYRGYFDTDRWGQQVFHTGPHHLFVSAAVAKQLQEYAGQPLKLTVSRLYQPQNPGGAIIEGISQVEVEGRNSGLILDIKTEATKVPPGEGIKLALVVRNTSPHPASLSPFSLALAIVTRSPYSNDAMGYKDPDNRSYWYHSTAIPSWIPPGESTQKQLVVACHQSPLPWLPHEYAARNTGVEVGARTAMIAPPGHFYPLVIQPGGELRLQTTLGQELLPGQYEVFFYQPTGNLSHEPGPMSKRMSLDILEPVAEQ